MRLVNSAAIYSACFVLLLTSSLIAAPQDRMISGRLILDNSSACDRQCMVTLLYSGVRPIQTVTADLGGHFAFNRVPRGSYMIRIDVEGYEPVTHPIDDGDAVLEPMIIVSLVPKPAGQQAHLANV